MQQTAILFIGIGITSLVAVLFIRLINRNLYFVLRSISALLLAFLFSQSRSVTTDIALIDTNLLVITFFIVLIALTLIDLERGKEYCIEYMVKEDIHRKISEYFKSNKINYILKEKDDKIICITKKYISRIVVVPTRRLKNMSIISHKLRFIFIENTTTNKILKKLTDELEKEVVKVYHSSYSMIIGIAIGYILVGLKFLLF